MADPIDIPHFSYPFQFDIDRHVTVVEQDTIDDVTSCVSVAFLTDEGFRPEVPTFGTSHRVFMNQPLDLEGLIAEVEEWESRAEMVMSQMPDIRDPLIDRISAVIALQQAVAGG